MPILSPSSLPVSHAFIVFQIIKLGVLCNLNIFTKFISQSPVGKEKLLWQLEHADCNNFYATKDTWRDKKCQNNLKFASKGRVEMKR